MILFGFCLLYSFHFYCQLPASVMISVQVEWGAHCLDLVLNGLLTRRNFWRIPGMLENYMIPKWKEFLKSREPILRKYYLSTFIHVNKYMDGPRDIFWIKSLNGTFLALQIKAFGPKIFWFSCMGKKVPFWQFFRIFKNCQNGNFLPMHENLNFFRPNAFIWRAKKVPFSDFNQNMSLAPSMCLFMWIKVDK